MESELILIAKAIDENIKYMELKLEKPYLIGFNHNNAPSQEAEEIVNNLMKEIDAEIEEQKDIDTFLDEENKETQSCNEEYIKYVADSNSQLKEFETYASSNIPGYKKFVPPPPPREDYVPTDPSELAMDPEILTSPVAMEQEAENYVHSSEDPEPEIIVEKEVTIHPVENIQEKDSAQNSFDENILVNEDDLFPNESQMDLVTSPLIDSDHFKPVVAKKLDFDLLTVNTNQIKPFACSTEKKSKSPVKNGKTLKQLPEGMENISQIQDLGEKSTKEPRKPVRRILAERQPENQSGGVAKPERRHAPKPDVPPNLREAQVKDLPPSLNNLIRDTLSGRSAGLAGRRDTLGGGLPEGLRRDTLSGRGVLITGPRLDTLSGAGGRRDTLGGRRDTLGGRKELPTGLRDGVQWDTLSLRDPSHSLQRETLSGRTLPTGPLDGTHRDTLSGRNLPTGLRDGTHRDTLSGRNLPTGLRDGTHRDTLSGRNLPTGLRDGTHRDTLSGRNLPTGLRDGTHRDTLSGELMSSRRLSHYRVIPKMRLGALPSPPKQPVMSELGMKMIGKYRNEGFS